MAQRDIQDFLRDHVPVIGVTVRAGSSKSPRTLARLWHDDNDTTPPDVLIVGGFDASSVDEWVMRIDGVITDAGDPGPCRRIEILSAAGKPIASWQRSVQVAQAGSSTDPLAAAIQSMASAMTQIIGEVRQLVVVQNTCIAGLSEALIQRDERLYVALDQMVDAHREAANTTLDAALMVVESTTLDAEGPGPDNGHLMSVLSAVASNLGIPIPAPTPDPPAGDAPPA